MKLKRTEKVRRTTLAPHGLVEKDNYYIIGDKYVRVLTVSAMPKAITEGFLAQFISSPDYHIDFSTSLMNIDFASYMQKEINHLEEQINKTNTDTAREELITRYYTMQETIKQMVANKSRTMNVVINIYITADDLQKLNEKTIAVKNRIQTDNHMRLHTLPRLQVGAMQKNSPLFIGNSLNKYVDYHIGVMLPTLTGAALWPFFYDSIDDKYGTSIGVEANTGGKIIFDQFAYLNDTENAKAQGRTAGNMLVIGKTGMGKTVFMTLLICSHIINHRKVIWLDPENKNRELTRKLEGNYIEVGLNKNVINIFDLQPVSTDADEKESEEVMYDTKIAIKNVVEDMIIMFKTLWPNITEDEINVLDEITEKTYRVVGIDGTESFRYLKPEDYPTFTTFSVVIDQMLEEYENSSLKNKKVIEALLNLQMKMRSLVGTAGIEGHLSRYFNGTTNINMDSLDTIGLVSFGTKHLMNTPKHIRNALLRIIFKYAWSNCLSTDEQTVFVTDEDHTYIQNEPIAALKAQFQRRARKYNTVTISGTQEVKDYNNDRIQVHGAAIFNNATYRVYFNMELDGIFELGKLVHLTDQEMDTIRFLLPHYCLFENGNRKIPVHILMSDKEKEFFGT
ncbi:MAG TPA: hypothetical protein PLK68_07425 [Thomasclavelia ramosa]|nr:hypothetical protein [Thomasclavelia ramosa]